MDGDQRETVYFLGDPRDGKWSGTHVSSLESEGTLKFGQLFVVMSLSAPSHFDSRLAGELLFQNLCDVYYGEKEGVSVLARLEKAMMTTAKRLEYLLQREEIAAEEGIDLNLTIAVIIERFIYLATLGDGSVMLWRNKALIDLTQGLKDSSGRNLVKSGSGKINKGDVFVLLSQAAVLELSETELKNAIKNRSFEGINHRKKEPLLGALLIMLSSGEAESERVEQKIKDVTSVVSAQGDDTDLKKGEGEKVDSIEKDALEGDRFREEEEKDSQAGVSKEESEEERDDERKDIAGRLKGAGTKFRDTLSDKKTYQVLGLKAKESATKIFKLFIVYIWEGVLGLGGRGMYMRGGGKRPIRGIIILIVLAASLLFLSIRGIERHKGKSAETEEVEQIFSQVDQKFEDGRNLGKAGNVSEAVKILEEALALLDNTASKEVYKEEIEQRRSEGIAILDEVRKVIVITDGDIVTDIAGYIEGADANDISLLDQVLYISDMSTSSIYQVSTSGGEVSKVIGADNGLGTPNTIVFDGEGNLFISDLEKGMYKYFLSESRGEVIAGLSVTSIGEVADIENYVTPDGSNILYLLRASNGDIRKITRYESGYSIPALRLASEGFADAIDLEIDGRIYVLSASEGIMRYFGDGLDPYTLVGLDEPIEGPSCMELDDQLAFIGDIVNKRVVIVTKGSSISPQQGKYVAQIQYRGENDYLSDIREIIVDDGERTIYILANTTIFKADLNKIDEYAETLL